jgi:PilM
MMVGRSSSGFLTSANGFATGIIVPLSIPNGALVIVGK